MFNELTEELLELRAVVQGGRNAFLAQTRPRTLCCTCSCCTVVYE
jgi:hypothetical protein